MAQLSRSRTTRRTFAVACALTPKGAGVLNCERLLPEIEAAEAMLSRFELILITPRRDPRWRGGGGVVVARSQFGRRRAGWR
ncbi:MAG TPA: hypothetical protein VF241_01985 [Propionibacteriaceae bacterium]